MLCEMAWSKISAANNLSLTIMFTQPRHFLMSRAFFMKALKYFVVFVIARDYSLRYLTFSSHLVHTWYISVLGSLRFY